MSTCIHKSFVNDVLFLYLGYISLHIVTVEPPRSQVALPGTIVNYTCYGENHVMLRFNGVTSASASVEADNYLKSLGISYIYKHTNVWAYEFSINASTTNNGTYFQCEEGSDTSPLIYVYTVDGRGQYN